MLRDVFEWLICGISVANTEMKVIKPYEYEVIVACMCPCCALQCPVLKCFSIYQSVLFP